jgi:hypothetical protein
MYAMKYTKGLEALLQECGISYDRKYGRILAYPSATQITAVEGIISAHSAAMSLCLSWHLDEVPDNLSSPATCPLRLFSGV